MAGTTSGVYDFTVTRDQFITSAMQALGVFDPNDTLDPNTSSVMASNLNMIIKQRQGMADFAAGVKFWTWRTGCIFMQQYQGSYALGPSSTDKWTNGYNFTSTSANANSGATQIVIYNTAPNLVVFGSQSGFNVGDQIGLVYNQNQIFWTTISAYNSGTATITLAAVLPAAMGAGTYVFNYTAQAQRPIPPIRSLYLRDFTNNDIVMNELTKEEYDSMPSKNDPNNMGDPTSAYFQDESGRNNLVRMYLGDVSGPVDASKRIHFSYFEPIQIFTQGTDVAEFPEEWFWAIVWELAKASHSFFPVVTWTQGMESNYQTAVSRAEQKNPDRIMKFFQSGLY